MNSKQRMVNWVLCFTGMVVCLLIACGFMAAVLVFSAHWLGALFLGMEVLSIGIAVGFMLKLEQYA